MRTERGAKMGYLPKYQTIKSSLTRWLSRLWAVTHVAGAVLLVVMGLAIFGAVIVKINPAHTIECGLRDSLVSADSNDNMRSLLTKAITQMDVDPASVTNINDAIDQAGVAVSGGTPARVYLDKDNRKICRIDDIEIAG